MERNLSAFFLLSVCFLLVDAGFYNPHLLSRRRYAADEETARKVNDQYHQYVEEAWQRQTKMGAGAPTLVSFYSPLFNSTITGKEMMTIKNRTIYAFQGFRYGVGERFKPPVLEGKFWTGQNFNATHIGFKCPQGAFVGSEPAGSEDCLYLNVYTPVIPPGTQKLPVIFYIHGGGFTFGDSTTYMPTRFLDHDVILVVIHYRLGSLGFWTLNNEDAPGNIALYDMATALSWTQNYIEDFGGDKTKVTVMGESAGSVSANYMMIVPQARGLHRAVIAESGSCFDFWAVDDDWSYATHYIANYVGCDSTDETEIYNCMRLVDFQDIVKATGSLTSTDEHNGLSGFRGISPIIQTFNLSASAPFDLILTKRPKEYFAQKDFSMVPFMTGANKQEGSLTLAIMYSSYLEYNNLTNNVTYMREQVIQDVLHTIGIYDDTKGLATSLQKVYCPGIDLGNFTAAAPCLIDLTGVMFLKAGSWEVANYHSYYSGQPTYYYSFEFASDDSLFNFLAWMYPFDGGITHADELMYLFSLPAVMDVDNGQVLTMDRMTKMWTNFVTYLDPTPADQQAELEALGIPIWTPYQFEDHHLLVIAENLTVEKEFSDRWTITVDELQGGQMERECTGLCVGKKRTAKDNKEIEEKYKEQSDEYKENSDEYKDQQDEYKDERDKYKNQRDIYMATSIAFLVVAAIAAGVAIFLTFKIRR